VPDWRLNAKKVYGFRGVVSNARASNTCLLLHWGGEWPGEQCAIGLAGWMLHFYHDFYQFTGNRKFLAERFVPLAKEIALFYGDFLAGTEDANGKYRFYMGYSPEHGMSANTTFDIAIAKNVFATLIAACKVLGSDQDKLPQWQAMLDKMPPYLCNERGELQEWSWSGIGEDYNQRHHSHFLPLYQFCEFSRDRTPGLWQASGLAFEQKTKHWLWNAADADSNHITHGMMNQGQCAARLGRSDVVYDVLERMTTRRYVFPSFMISYWPDLKGFGFDPVGTILVPGLLVLLKVPFIFGWAKPVPVNFGNLRHPKRDMIWVAAAGPASNFVQALVSPLEVKVREPMVCASCSTKDCVRGSEVAPGCRRRHRPAATGGSWTGESQARRCPGQVCGNRRARAF
jgi:alpha-L-fucosidase 2